MDGGGTGGWARELHDLERGVSGALLFGTPLLFTMEMWWLGPEVTDWRLLAILLVALVANTGLAYGSGFRHQRSFGAAVEQAVVAVALGVVLAAAVLAVLNRITPDDPLASILGKMVLQAVPLSLGASVANAIFSPERNREGEGEASSRFGAETLRDVGATAIGAVFVAFSIAPTDEVPVLATGLTYGHELAVVALSLLAGYCIVFESGFDAEGPRPSGPFQSPLTETALAYVVSLAVSAGVLLLFGDLPDTAAGAMSQTLVLGFPAMVGGAAGRLVI